jgi:hypothetical protein
MCIQMTTHNYNHTLIVNITPDDHDIYIDTNDAPPPLIPIRSPDADFEYLHLIDKIQMNRENMEQYENIQYIIGTILSLYSIYYFVSRIFDSIYKKYI